MHFWFSALYYHNPDATHRSFHQEFLKLKKHLDVDKALEYRVSFQQKKLAIMGGDVWTD